MEKDAQILAAHVNKVIVRMVVLEFIRGVCDANFGHFR
jgi:hypothetical protein